ncbi:hypothetical protein GCM10022267_57260 [Lentzea roselyniae]|uniref:ABC-2 type transport system permease protein n=1 Tax=Lentzea roselyniae TaxID=531940 RepID=A0ABP7BL91_9PSEU
MTPSVAEVSDPATPSAAEVRRRLRRPPPPWRFRLARLYERLVNTAIAGAIGWGLAFKGLAKTGQAGASEWTALWLSVLAAVVLLKVLLAFGPVFAGRDRMFWVLSSPVDRAALLSPRFLGLLGFGAAVGAVWPAVVFGVVGVSAPPGVWVFAGSAAAGVAVVAGAVVLQRARLRPQNWLSVLAAAAVLALFLRSDVVAVEMIWLVPAAVPLVVVAAASLRRLNRADLSTGGALAAAVRVSVSWLDLALLGAILAERRARLLGRVRSARLRGSPVTVLVWTDVLRARRAPNGLLVWAGLLPLPALVALGGEVDWVPAVHLVAAFIATDRLAAGLKSVCRSASIRRMLGVPDWTLRLAHLVVPATGAVVWCVATATFTPHVSWLNAAVSAVGALAVVYRIATKPPLDYGVAAIDFGVLGPVPIGLVLQLSRGPLLLYLLCVLQVVLG